MVLDEFRRVICDGDGGGGDIGDGGCLQPCWTVRVVSDRDLRGLKECSAHLDASEHVRRADIWPNGPGVV